MTYQATATAEVGPTKGPETTATSPGGAQLLTDELIDSISRGHCGWSRKQIELLGAPWPLVAGWREKLVGEERSLTGEEVEALYVARKKKRPEGPAEADPALVTELPCPWCSRMVKRVEQGGHTREFCCKAHKNAYNAALNRLSLTYARTIRTPGALQSWAEERVDPSGDTASGPPRCPVGPEGQVTPSTAPGAKN